MDVKTHMVKSYSVNYFDLRFLNSTSIRYGSKPILEFLYTSTSNIHVIGDKALSCLVHYDQAGKMTSSKTILTSVSLSFA